MGKRVEVEAINGIHKGAEVGEWRDKFIVHRFMSFHDYQLVLANYWQTYPLPLTHYPISRESGLWCMRALAPPPIALHELLVITKLPSTKYIVPLKLSADGIIFGRP